MSFRCIVPGCRSTSDIHPNLKFLQIPKFQRGEKWFDAIKEGTGDQKVTRIENVLYSSNLNRVCEHHFKPDDFTICAGVKIHKPDAVPSIFNKESTLARNIMDRQEIMLRCRICVSRQGINSIMSWLPTFKITITEAFKETFNVNLKFDRSLPQKICLRCLNILQISYSFKMEVRDADEQILDITKRLEQIEAQNSKNKPSVTILEASEENAVFIINELPDSGEIKYEQEMPIEGEQATFTETLSDDEIKKEPEGLSTSNLVISTVQSLTSMEQEALERRKILKTYSNRRKQSKVPDPKLTNLKKDKIEPKPTSKSIDLDVDSMLEEELKKEHLTSPIKSFEEWPDSLKKVASTEFECSNRRKLSKVPDPKLSSSKKESPSKSIDLDVDSMLEEALKKEKMTSPTKSYEEWPEEEKPVRAPVKKVKSSKFECTNCKHRAQSQWDLYKHLDTSEKKCIEQYEANMACSLCQRKFFIKSSLIKHVKNEHKDDTPADGKCPHCKRLSCHYKKPVTYERHYRSHVTEPKIICPECGKKFYSIYIYCSHAAVHRNEKKEPSSSLTYYCDHCSYETKVRACLISHLRKHSSAKFVCELCSKALTCPQARQSHNFRIHKIAENGCYYCRSCDYCFLKRFEFKQHITRCNGPTGKKHPPLCVRVPRKDFGDDIEIKNL